MEGWTHDISKMHEQLKVALGSPCVYFSHQNFPSPPSGPFLVQKTLTTSTLLATLHYLTPPPFMIRKPHTPWRLRVKHKGPKGMSILEQEISKNKDMPVLLNPENAPPFTPVSIMSSTISYQHIVSLILSTTRICLPYVHLLHANITHLTSPLPF